MRIAWLTDIHLNFVSSVDERSFTHKIMAEQPDAVIITGDIGESGDVAEHLEYMANVLRCPIFFTLGNHDFYNGSIGEVRDSVRKLISQQENLIWLSDAAVIQVTESLAIVGHDSWADGRLGDYDGSCVELNDFYLIDDFAGLDRRRRLNLMQFLAEQAADHFRRTLPSAFESVDYVILATHVPPFKESCWHGSRTSNDMFLPFFSCKVVGDVLMEIMTRNPTKSLTVLCGHTHGGGEAQIRHNLKVLTGEATYGQPVIQRVLDLK
ncbi:MAG: metallophosphoesterase [candidate division Zixibacteria bacterium]|nr:metallophosphoesterase [candidate division Zixibacteria bacterium]